MEIILIIVGLIALVFIGDKFLKQSMGIDESVFLNHIQGIPNLGKGVKILVLFYPDKITIDNKKIIPLSRIKQTTFISQKEVIEYQKNAIARGAVGLLLGPLGAIVGAISGVGTKTEQLDVYYFTVEFIDINGNDAVAIFTLSSVNDFLTVQLISNKINEKLGIQISHKNINVPHEI